MPAVVRLGDRCSAHDSCQPRPSITASEDTAVNGKGVVRVTDKYAECNGYEAVQESGSPDVFINSLPVARVGDSLDDGSTNIEGSPDFFIN
jgi:uncharacterized Zn-binding protein involved in type VI secretion